MQRSIKMRFFITISLLVFTPLLLLGKSDCNIAGIRSAIEEYKRYPSSATFVNLRSVRDSMEFSDKYADCKTHSYYWLKVTEINLLLAYSSDVTSAEKLLYLNTAESAGQNAARISEKSSTVEDQLPLFMVSVYSGLANFYASIQDTSAFNQAMLELDSVSNRSEPPVRSTVDNEQVLECPGYPVFLSTNKIAPFIDTTSRINVQTIICQIFLFDDSTKLLTYDSSLTCSLHATDINTNQIIESTTNKSGEYVLMLSAFNFYSLTIQRTGYVTQVRTLRTDGSGPMIQRFYLAKPGADVYYSSYDMQVPYKKDDHIIGINMNENCRREDFDLFIDSLNLTPCGKDSLQLYRKKSGQVFNATKDTILAQLRRNTQVISWAGPVVVPMKNYPRVLTNVINIYFLKSESQLSEQERASFNQILNAHGFIAKGGGLYEGPRGIGSGINLVTHQINQLPFVWYAVAETIQKEK